MTLITEINPSNTLNIPTSKSVGNPEYKEIKENSQPEINGQTVRVKFASLGQ